MRGGMLVLSNERLDRILNLVNQKGSVRLSFLSEQLGASESTIRRDINQLHEEGRLKRVHGGATTVSKRYIAPENSLSERIALNQKEKTIIAKAALEFVDDYDTIFIDAGTTTKCLVDLLDKKNLLVVTNSLSHAQTLVSKGIRVIVLGGEIRPLSEAVEGPFALELLKQLNFDKAFLGTNAFSIGAGYTTPSPNEAQIKRTALERASQAYVLADSSKQGLVTLSGFASLEDAILITDRVDEEYRFINPVLAKEVHHD